MTPSGFLRVVAMVLTTAFTGIALAQLPAAPAATVRKEVIVKHETLARYVGTYELAPQMIVSISLDGEQLHTQLSGQAKFPVFPESDTKFFLKVVDAQLEFKLDAAGNVSSLMLHQNGSDFEARRTGSTVVERKEVKLTDALLIFYTGTYVGSPLSFVITLESGHLMVQPTGQQKLELFAEAQDKFFLKAVDVQIEFVREAGKIKALVLHQGPGVLRAERQQ